MQQLRGGSFRLFQVAGITVYLHWSWFLVAYWQIFLRDNSAFAYERSAWKVAEYMTLFGIVLLHEFGHALACRSVGGIAEQIILWPLGGVAYVNPPPRPGAMLWSLAAGPLVNLLLVPVTGGLYLLAQMQNWQEVNSDSFLFVKNIALLNGLLLIFNMLPIYPLDGGQIVQALLWFLMGRAESLMVVSILGLVAGGGLLVLFLGLGLLGGGSGVVWLVVIAGFIVFRSWVGFQQARALSQLLAAPRDHNLACPFCGASPIIGPHWICHRCREQFDLFEQDGVCPGCGASFPATRCFECQRMGPLAEW